MRHFKEGHLFKPMARQVQAVVTPPGAEYCLADIRPAPAIRAATFETALHAVSGEEERMGILRSTLVLFAISVGLTSALLAQSSSPFPRLPPPADEPPAADAPPVRAKPAARRAQTPPATQLMDKAHRDRLLQLLAREGKQEGLDPSACAALGIRTGGQPLPVMQVGAVEGKTREAFSRVENRKDEYVFSFDQDKDNPNSPGYAFHAGANFRLIGGAEFANGRWVKMPPAKAATLYAQQMRDWVATIDGN
jgi:hypothetical protein